MKWLFLLYILSLAIPAAVLMRPPRPVARRVRRVYGAMWQARRRVWAFRLELVGVPV